MNKPGYFFKHVLNLLIVWGLVACSTAVFTPAQPSVLANKAVPESVSLPVDNTDVPTMYRHALNIDLHQVLHLVQTQNLDIALAKQKVKTHQGDYEASWEKLVPALAPGWSNTTVEGAISGTHGPMLTSLNYTLLSVLLTVLVNPGQVVYDLLAAHRTLNRARMQQRASIEAAIHQAVIQYYELILAQANLQSTKKALSQAQELLRIENLRLQTGTGLKADQLRAQSAARGAEQDTFLAIQNFYDASIQLSLTLNMDASVLLVPQARELQPKPLLKDDLDLVAVKALALLFRPDLAALAEQIKITQANKEALRWSVLSPQLQISLLAAPAPLSQQAPDTLMREQREATSLRWTLTPAVLGQMKAAESLAEEQNLEFIKKQQDIYASIIHAQQTSSNSLSRLPLVQEQVSAAEQALHLVQQNLSAGTGLVIDVLQAQSDAEKARVHLATIMIRYNQAQADLLYDLGMMGQLDYGGPHSQDNISSSLK